MLFTANISFSRFRQRVENLCAERVCSAPLCSLKIEGTGEEERDRGMKMREKEGTREGSKERRRDKERDSSHVFMICLCCRWDPFFFQTPPSFFFSLPLCFFFLFFSFSHRLTIFSVMSVPAVQAALSVSLLSDVSIKINVFSLLR